ncbi:MAG TPA: tryptophan--tRNA ligase [Anaerolineales bacterium]|nr:tryptophan--tRNA ligase [Anaerolineales bacterium]
MSENPASPTTPSKPRVLSGIQPSGILHLGNYLGAISNWVADQAHYENFFMIADYHALTSVSDGAELRKNRREIVAMLLACGIDPQQSVLFYQSQLPEHTELGWIMTCLSPLGWLERMTQYKDKSAKYAQEGISTGLLTYPALQAADILLYQAQGVPVGEDQRQHVELTRDLAQRFNHLFGETFTIPQVFIRKEGAKVMSLTEPVRKMSKSDKESDGRIELLDSADVIRRKIRRAQTDSLREICFSDDPERAGVNNLLELYKILTHKEPATITAEFEGKGYGELKDAVADVVVAVVNPIREEYHRLLTDRAHIEQVMAGGKERAQAVARKTLGKVKKRIGMV